MSNDYAVTKRYDIDGNEVRLGKLCALEPEWAANRIEWLEAELADLGQRYQFSLDGRTYAVKAVVPMTPEQASHFAAELETVTGKPVTWEERP